MANETSRSKIKMIAIDNIKILNLNKEDILILRDLMDKKSISMPKLSKLTGGKVSHSMIRGLLNYQTNSISLEKFLCICEALEVEIESILNCSTLTYTK